MIWRWLRRVVLRRAGDDRMAMLGRSQGKDFELGTLYRKIGPGQPIWRVDSLVRHAPLPHVKLTRPDAPATQMTVSVATLTDARFFERVQSQ